jgi:hypothetical protein
MRISNLAIRHWQILSLGIFFAIIIQGCTNDVVVKCGLGTHSSKPGDEGPGGCNSAGLGLIPPPPATICKKSNGTVMDCPPNATCTSGVKCANYSGTCPDRVTPCKTRWTQISGSNGSCTCGCS